MDVIIVETEKSLLKKKKKVSKCRVHHFRNIGQIQI